MDVLPQYEEIFKQIKTNFWLIGIPFGDYRFKIRFIIYVLMLDLMIIAESSFLFSKITSDNLLEITQLTPCLCIGFLSMLKICAIFVKRRKINTLTEKLRQLYNVTETDPTKTSLVVRDVVLLKKFTQYFFILNGVLISVYNFAPPFIIYYNYRQTNEISFFLPYSILLPFEVNSWTSWGLVYIFSIACGIICVYCFATIDVLYCVMATIICCNFKIIGNKIESLSKMNVVHLKDIIKEHQYYSTLVEEMEDIFTLPNFFNVLIGSVEICALGFNITAGEVRQIPGCILFLASVLLQILLMSIFGENIKRQSIKVGDSAYNCKWYEMDGISKKMLLTLLTRSLKPQVFTAYRFSVIDYGSFSKIISTSWSYFTILRTVYTPPEISNE